MDRLFSIFFLIKTVFLLLNSLNSIKSIPKNSKLFFKNWYFIQKKINKKDANNLKKLYKPKQKKNCFYLTNNYFLPTTPKTIRFFSLLFITPIILFIFLSTVLSLNKYNKIVKRKKYTIYNINILCFFCISFPSGFFCTFFSSGFSLPLVFFRTFLTSGII